MNPINHVAIIMDGNGRWGLKKKKSRNLGHRAGLNTVEKIIKHTIKNKIKFLTLYAFSTENWKRPQKEISFLFNLLKDFLIKKTDQLNKNGIKFNDILNELEEDLLKSDYIVAHNLNFDRSSLLAELTRNNCNNLIHLFESKKHICTLKESINVCCISRSPNGSYKWPKLSELYEKLFNRKLRNAHNARYDVENLSLCFFKLIENGEIRLS